MCEATVTSKCMITIPSRIRKKYGIKEGMKVKFVELDAGVLLVPVPSLGELFGADRECAKELIEAVKELEEEHRAEAGNS